MELDTGVTRRDGVLVLRWDHCLSRNRFTGEDGRSDRCPEDSRRLSREYQYTPKDHDCFLPTDINVSIDNRIFQMGTLGVD